MPYKEEDLFKSGRGASGGVSARKLDRGDSPPGGYGYSPSEGVKSIQAERVVPIIGVPEEKRSPEKVPPKINSKGKLAPHMGTTNGSAQDPIRGSKSEPPNNVAENLNNHVSEGFTSSIKSASGKISRMLSEKLINPIPEICNGVVSTYEGIKKSGNLPSAAVIFAAHKNPQNSELLTLRNYSSSAPEKQDWEHSDLLEQDSCENILGTFSQHFSQHFSEKFSENHEKNYVNNTEVETTTEPNNL